MPAGRRPGIHRASASLKTTKTRAPDRLNRGCKTRPAQAADCKNCGFSWTRICAKPRLSTCDLISKTFPDNQITCARRPWKAPNTTPEIFGNVSTPLRHITLLGTTNMNRWIAVLALSCAFAHAEPQELVVTAKIIETGHTRYGDETCVIRAEVRNASALPISVVMMDCGWDLSWLTKPEGALWVDGWDCLKNAPEKYSFAPAGGYSFLFTIRPAASVGHIEGKHFRLGFVNATSLADYGDLAPGEKRPERSPAILWSDELTIPRISDHVLQITPERKELPNQPPSHR